MPIQRLDTTAQNVSAPQNAAAQSAQAAQQRNALDQSAAGQNAAILADATKTNVQTNLNVFDTNTKRNIAEKQIAAQRAANNQKALLSAASLAQQGKQFATKQAFAEKQFDFEKQRLEFDGAVSDLDKFSQQTVSLPRDDDGKFLQSGLNDIQDSLEAKVGFTSDAFGNTVSKEAIRMRTSVPLANFNNAIQVEADKVKKQKQVDDSALKIKKSAELENRRTSNFLLTIQSRKESIASQLSQSFSDGTFSQSKVRLIFADSMGVSPEMREAIRLVDAGTPEEARRALAKVAPEERAAFQKSMKQLPIGVPGTNKEGEDSVVNTFDDIMKAAGIPKSVKSQVRTGFTSFNRKLTGFARTTKEHAGREVTPAIEGVNKFMFESFPDNPERARKGMELFRSRFSLPDSALSEEDRKIRSVVANPDPTQEQIDEVGLILVQMEQLDRVNGTTIAQRAMTSESNGGLLPAPKAPPRSSTDLGTLLASVQGRSAAPDEAPVDQGSAQTGATTPIQNPALKAITATPEELSARSRFETSQSQSKRIKGIKDKEAQNLQTEDELNAIRRAEGRQGGGISRVVGSLREGIDTLALSAFNTDPEAQFAESVKASKILGGLGGSKDELKRILNIDNRTIDKQFQAEASRRLESPGVREQITGANSKKLDALLDKDVLTDRERAKLVRLTGIATRMSRGKNMKKAIKDTLSTHKGDLTKGQAKSLRSLLNNSPLNISGKEQAQKVSETLRRISNDLQRRGASTSKPAQAPAAEAVSPDQANVLKEQVSNVIERFAPSGIATPQDVAALKQIAQSPDAASMQRFAQIVRRLRDKAVQANQTAQANQPAQSPVQA